METIEKISVITCPHCGFKNEEEMPLEACVYFYTCKKCGTTIKPEVGDCCVYCSYGSFPCPPKQTNKNCR
jgi:hypothetical protein